MIQARLQEREQEQFDISKTYFQYKYDVDKSKQQIADEKELLNIEKRALEDSLSEIKERTVNEKEYAVDLYKQKTDSFAQRFRKITKDNENDLKVTKVQFEQFREDTSKTLEELEKNIHICQKKVKILDRTRGSEYTSLSSDISSLKKRVINFERYIKRLKAHVDEEKTTELITELENTEVAQVDMEQLINDISRIEYEIKQASKANLY
jgi:hypothetical protein